MFRANILILFFASLFNLTLNGQSADPSAEDQFRKLLHKEWHEAFLDQGTGDWKEQWFLDGERGSVKNTPDGMVFSAGPVRGDNGSHNVLWTRESFDGDIKIEFDYTRLDDINYAVNILYIQATGIGEGPYTEDIAEWSNLRIVPYMKTYFMHMNLLHISFAAYPLQETPQKDYVRARRYPVKPGQSFGSTTRIYPDYDSTGLFQPGVSYHFTVIKQGEELYFHVGNEDVSELFYWNTSGFQAVTAGRVGIRHMYTRAARYANISISSMNQ